MGPSQGKGNGSGNEFPSRKNFLLQLPQTLAKRERKKAKASAVTVIIIKCMRCHQGCKGPFLPLFLYKNKKKTGKSNGWEVEKGKGAKAGEKARERNNTCCNYSSKSRFNGCGDVYMNELCVYIITPNAQLDGWTGCSIAGFGKCWIENHRITIKGGGKLGILAGIFN